MKKCRCKCRRAGGRAMLAPTAKGNRDVQTVKECQDWLISEYDLEMKRLTAERDKAIKALEVSREKDPPLFRPAWCPRRGNEENGGVGDARHLHEGVEHDPWKGD